MKTLGLMISILVVAFVFAVSETAAQNGPTIDALLALEKQADRAWSTGDSKFFDDILSDKFVLRNGSQRIGKAAFLRMLSDAKCEVKAVKLDEPWMVKVNPDTYVLSYRRTNDGTCVYADGTSEKLPSPVRVATVWIRSGDRWQATFYGANPIVDPKNVSLSTVAQSSKAIPRDAKTITLAALEKNAWEAWKDHDLKKIDRLAAKGLSFIDIFGNAYDNRETILKTWSSNVCKVKSVIITDAVSFPLSPTVALLTHIGTADGTCYGEKLGQIYGNSLYVKEQGAWKLAFTMNMPAT